MAKTLLHRLFGVGRVPAAWIDVLVHENIVLQDEGVPGTVTYRNFRAPGRYSSWRKQWFTAALIVTRVRFVTLRGSKPLIDVPLTDQRIGRMGITVDGALGFAFEAGLFHADWSGSIEYRFRTERAAEIAAVLAGR